MRILILFIGFLTLFISAYISTDVLQDGEVLTPKDDLLNSDEVLYNEFSKEQLEKMKKEAKNLPFDAEIQRLMKIIINFIYRHKEIFLRELISNASDALDKIRFLFLTKTDESPGELNITIKVDKENKVIHIIDTGIGMTRNELVSNLGTIAKSGTSQFLKEMADGKVDTNELIGQFGVGFYSAFLVADKVAVISKHNDDDQYIWESDGTQFNIAKDPRGNTLHRGTQVSLHLKEEAHEYLDDTTIINLIKKYSQFINFPIYFYQKTVKKVEEPIEPIEEEKSTKDKDDVEVEEESDAKKEKTKTVEKTVWEYNVMNEVKPIWTRKPTDISEKEYVDFYKSITKDSAEPLNYTHFVAEGEVSFKAVLYIGKTATPNMLDHNKKVDNIKLYVRRVFITSDFDDMMPRYLTFVTGVVDSDDLPLHISRETLQLSKLMKVIKRKLVRKVLEMIKRMSVNSTDYAKFWKEYSTNIKLGVVEDTGNKMRLAKLLRFSSSHNETHPTSLDEYLDRMQEKQDGIYFVAGQSMKEVKNSPFVERLLKKGYEVLYMIEPIDEYCIQALPEYEGKKFINVAKEGLVLDQGKKSEKHRKSLEKKFEPLMTWLKDKGLKDKIEKSQISERLADSPCALIASTYGWSGNMERIMKSSAYAKSNDPMTEYYANMKKTLEINPRHPLIKELLRRVQTNPDDNLANDMATLLFETATLRSGYSLADTKGYAQRVERMMKMSFDLGDEQIEPEQEILEDEEDEEGESEEPESPENTADNKDSEDLDDEETIPEKDGGDVHHEEKDEL